MLAFPNVSDESSFIRAYAHALSVLREDVRRYLSVHSFEKEKYDAMFAERLSDLYTGLTDVWGGGLISEEVMTALALQYHKEVREMSAEFFGLVDDYSVVLAEYEKVKHLLGR